MKQLTRLIGVILLIINIYSCDIHWYDPDKPKPGCLNQMPEETSIGANIFGCYINEELAALQGFFQQEGIALISGEHIQDMSTDFGVNILNH